MDKSQIRKELVWALAMNSNFILIVIKVLKIIGRWWLRSFGKWDLVMDYRWRLKEREDQEVILFGLWAEHGCVWVTESEMRRRGRNWWGATDSRPVRCGNFEIYAKYLGKRGEVESGTREAQACIQYNKWESHPQISDNLINRKCLRCFFHFSCRLWLHDCF